MRRLKDKLSSNDKNALVQKCVTPAIFGESRFLDQIHAPSKCCVVAESLVEVLLFDHMRLQEMDLQPEVISELLDVAPKYLSEKEVAQKQADVATWDEYRNLRLLELSKNRWPEAKASLDSGGSRGESSPPLTALALLLSSHPRASMTDTRVLAISRGTSVGDDDEREDSGTSPNVYKFDVAQYKDGSFRFVPACARDLIKYTGRLLHHGAQAARKTKINTVQFDKYSCDVVKHLA
ncbi:Hypothetical protein PHPALM_5527 [Phytophthora palmivora]|uniref:Uncharacterized protein n=1 Tax=Phytophthora palmivora TaxID=4796 RepID=A0A2P4YH52_9STRA|nr:Hypothetical protein PHPALM_5527 [Phytophthora palmivora]